MHSPLEHTASHTQRATGELPVAAVRAQSLAHAGLHDREPTGPDLTATMGPAGSLGTDRTASGRWAVRAQRWPDTACALAVCVSPGTRRRRATFPTPSRPISGEPQEPISCTLRPQNQALKSESESACRSSPPVTSAQSAARNPSTLCLWGACQGTPVTPTLLLSNRKRSQRGFCPHEVSLAETARIP